MFDFVALRFMHKMLEKISEGTHPVVLWFTSFENLV